MGFGRIAIGPTASGVRRRLRSHALEPSARRVVAVPARLRRATDRTGVHLSDAQLWLGCATAAALGSGTGAGVAGIGGAGLGLLAAVVGVGATLHGFRNRGRAHLVAALPDGLESIGRSVRSGASLSGALAEAAPSVAPVLGADFRTITGQVVLGLPFADAVAAWGLRRRTPEVGLTVAALTFADQTGTRQARALEGLADSLRDRQMLRRELDALSSQARTSAAVMALLPIAFLLLSATAGSEATDFLLQRNAGRLCLVAGISLDGLGLWWMHRITAAVR